MSESLFDPSEHCRKQASEHWFYARQNDSAAIGLYLRHYSAGKNGASENNIRQSGFVGPGAKIVLITGPEDAMFAWRFDDIYRFDSQTGVNCSVFRNESDVLSSVLIREACAVAWEKWPGARLFTFVNGEKVRRKRDPGRCFIRAGWTRCGESKAGLLIFEAMPQTEGEN